MRSGRTLAFVAIALLVGGIVSQLPSALGDDSDNPLSALWDAIFDLQSRDEDLQAQIDELRVEGVAPTSAGSELVSDLYAVIKAEVTEDGRTLVHITAGNSGPDRAAGVKVTAFYLMPLFEINSLDDQCEDKSRGIIECVIGTLGADQEAVVTIDATAKESGEENTWTADISTTTDDADYINNHVTYTFETGSAEPVDVPEDDGAGEEPEAEPEPEQDSSTSNSTETETEESPSGNQTSTDTGNESDETSGGNQTSTEETPSGDETSAETDEGAVDNSSSGTSTEESADESSETEQGTPSEEGSEEPSSEGSGEGSTQEEQSGEPETGDQAEQGPEQEQSGDGGSGEPPEEGSEPGGEEGSNEGGAESGQEAPQ